VTSSRFRRRSQAGREPAFDGDFGGSDDATEHLHAIRPATWDGTTITFGGASGAGLPPGQVYTGADPAARVRQAIEMTALAERGPAVTPPAIPRALPLADDKIARSMTPGWAHLFEVRCAYPATAHATPIPCDSTHRDDTARSFRALRQSAQAAGWHLDTFGRWACPACCQDSPEYRTLYPLIIWEPDAAEAAQAAAQALQNGLDPARALHAEFWFRAVGEHDLFRSVRDAARRGRHEGGAR
jgi:hypothetical protein